MTQTELCLAAIHIQTKPTVYNYMGASLQPVIPLSTAGSAVVTLGTINVF